MKVICYKILVSACLLGERVRYDAKINKIQHQLLEKWLHEDIILPACPEVLGGLPIPRPAAEIKINGNIETAQGDDVSKAFSDGAQKTLAMALKHNIKVAILTERSPSCGSTEIYDGSFSRKVIDGQGMTTKLLRDNGVFVFNQFQLQEAQNKLNELASSPI
tara:strand:+ start:21401 stop:21886 length:486 start_codon:yes stop_codon:yes gene_type:complete